MLRIPKLCTACGACINKCPVKCISIKVNEFGFYTPIIDNKKCVECNLCQEICPVINERCYQNNWDKGLYYVGIANDNIIRIGGSSGGMFQIVAQKIIEENGIVYGAAYIDNCHEVVQTHTDKNSLSELCKSKYVESNTEYIFRHVKQQLESGRKVLYTGTSCQIDGLYAFLGKRYENLISIDLLCHGTPGIGIYQAYINKLEKKYGLLNKIDFRSKSYGWKSYCVKAEFNTGKQYLKTKYIDPYITLFFDNLIIRESCLKCTRLKNSQADITLGDAWGVKMEKLSQDNLGYSLIGIHTDAGKKLFDSVGDRIKSFAVSIEDVKYAYEQQLSDNKNRNKILEDFKNGVDIFLIEKTIKNIIKGKLYYLRAVLEKLKLGKGRNE